MVLRNDCTHPSIRIRHLLFLYNYSCRHLWMLYYSSCFQSSTRTFARLLGVNAVGLAEIFPRCGRLHWVCNFKSTMDVLLVLRQAIKARLPITCLDANSQPCHTLQQATYISLGSSTKIPKTATTRFQKPNASTRDWVGHPEDFFTLQAVFVAWMARDAPTTEYLKQARENLAGAGFVSVTDRKLLVEWLEGKSVELERLIPIGS